MPERHWIGFRPGSGLIGSDKLRLVSMPERHWIGFRLVAQGVHRMPRLKQFQCLSGIGSDSDRSRRGRRFQKTCCFNA